MHPSIEHQEEISDPLKKISDENRSLFYRYVLHTCTLKENWSNLFFKQNTYICVNQKKEKLIFVT
jgi:hypothetical protein